MFDIAIYNLRNAFVKESVFNAFTYQLEAWSLGPIFCSK